MQKNKIYKPRIRNKSGENRKYHLGISNHIGKYRNDCVYIEPTNLCNIKCAFCPTSDKQLLEKVGRPAGNMPFELFCKIVDELKEFNTEIKLVSLYKDGEPLVNSNFSEMVRYLSQSGITKRIWTKTNGVLLRPELNDRLSDSGLTWIGISVVGVSAEGYLKGAGVKIDYDQYVANIADLYRKRGNCELYIKIADSGLSPEEINKFYHDFADICDYCAVEKLMGWSNSGVKDFTLGTNPDTYDGLPLTDKEICAYPFYVMAFNADGSVSLCGNDWSHQTVVGNAANEHVIAIWNGERMYEFRRMMLERRRHENAACGNCYYLKIVPDNIDPYAEEILCRLQETRSHNRSREISIQ